MNIPHPDDEGRRAERTTRSGLEDVRPLPPEPVVEFHAGPKLTPSRRDRGVANGPRRDRRVRSVTDSMHEGHFA